MLTQERLKELLDYNPITGNFIRIKKASKNDIIGTIVGCPNKDGHLRIVIDYKHYLAHRLVYLYLYNRLPTEVDHINGNSGDNRLENLREVSHRNNMKNVKLRIDNKSGHVGVSYCSKRNIWRARIKTKTKDTHLGYFKTKEEAIEARLIASKEHGFHENHGRIN
jgi:hypothetical protein